jgi:hypothetical protein
MKNGNSEIFVKTGMTKKYLFILLFLLFFADLSGEKVTASGKAYMGHNITLEEAEKIALNKASQQALDSLGVFIESITEVKNGILTKEVVRGITGAIMTRKIVGTSKEIENDVIVIVVTVEFEIDNDSLNKALKSYMDRSRDKETIKHLLDTIQKLQKRLLTQTKPDLDSLEALETLEELDFNNKRLEKLLTTRQVIDHEFEIYEIYKEKVKRCIRSFLPKLVNDIQSEYRWDTVPRIRYSKLYIPHIKGRLGQHVKPEYCLPLKEIVDEYYAKEFKIIPRLKFYMRFAIPVVLHINNNSTVAQHIDVVILSIPYDTLISVGISGSFGYSGIFLSENYTLQNIEDIDVSIGNPDYRQIEIEFDGPGRKEREKLFSPLKN